MRTAPFSTKPMVLPCPFLADLSYAFAGSPILSCVLVWKSLASWRSCNWLPGSPEMRLTMRPRVPPGGFGVAAVHQALCQRAVPWPCRDIGNRILAAGEIFIVGQAPVEHVKLPLHFHGVAV